MIPDKKINFFFIFKILKKFKMFKLHVCMYCTCSTLQRNINTHYSYFMYLEEHLKGRQHVSQLQL